MLTYKTENGEKLLDAVGLHILQELQENARTPLAEIGRRVNLTAPAVAERVRRMEEAGIITGYHAQVDPDKVGLPITVIIRLALHGACTRDNVDAILEAANVTELYFTTGDDDLYIKASFKSLADMDRALTALNEFGAPTTTIVLMANSIAYRPLYLNGEAEQDGRD